MWTSVGKRAMSHVLERTKLEVSPGKSRVQLRPVFTTGVLSALLAGATPAERQRPRRWCMVIRLESALPSAKAECVAERVAIFRPHVGAKSVPQVLDDPVMAHGGAANGPTRF